MWEEGGRVRKRAEKAHTQERTVRDAGALKPSLLEGNDSHVRRIHYVADNVLNYLFITSQKFGHFQ